MELALMTEPQLGGTYDDLADSARWAEDAGLVAFARSDHYYWSGEPADATDAFVSLGGVARETERIRLVVLVSPLTFRHPAVMAKSAATLDQMSGGRFDLGVGTGWMEAEHAAFGLDFPEWSERFARLEEALPYVSAALRDERAAFDGSFYAIDASVRPLAPDVGLIVGGSGPRRTPRLAARWADEYNTFVRPAAELAPKIAVLREAAEEFGRDPASIRVSIMGGALVGSDRADYVDRLAAEASERGKEPDELEALFADRGMPHGTPEQAHELLAELAAIGVDRWYVQVIPHDLDTVRRAVSPLL
jgi:alkanesulfonate monooxygenase SsuD/methylene tetrahydromethanopterin reductase-like flavin-dependent oxidoreductase (luciferase family)